MRGLSIGKLAPAANASTDTVRYYERYGLLRVPARGRSGYRAYSEADLRRLLLIRRARAIGLSLEEIGQLLSLSRAADRTKSSEFLQGRLKVIEQQLAELQCWRSALLELNRLRARGAPPEDFLMQQLNDCRSSAPGNADT